MELLEGGLSAVCSFTSLSVFVLNWEQFNCSMFSSDAAKIVNRLSFPKYQHFLQTTKFTNLCSLSLCFKTSNLKMCTSATVLFRLSDVCCGNKNPSYETSEKVAVQGALAEVECVHKDVFFNQRIKLSRFSLYFHAWSKRPLSESVEVQGPSDPDPWPLSSSPQVGCVFGVGGGVFL